MAFHVVHRDGSMGEPAEDAFDALLGELDGPHDPEHPDVAVSHDTGWTLAAFPSGLLVFENVEEDSIEPRHLRGVGRAQAAELFRALSVGDLVTVEREAWQNGYGSA